MVKNNREQYKRDAQLRLEFCVEVTEPLTIGEALDIAGNFYEGGVPVAIASNENGTYTVWRKPFSDEWVEMPANCGQVEGCIMKRNHPKRETFFKILE